MEQRHAYLFLLHDVNPIFERCIRLIDHPRNDIYIHMDKKCKDFKMEYYKDFIRYSNIYMTDKRYNCAWGGYSLVAAEMELIKCAYCKGEYAYFHLMSGSDMPLVAQSTIHDFFERNNNVICLESADVGRDPKRYKRVDVYKFFSEYVHRRNKVLNLFFLYMEKASTFIQRYIMRIDLVKKKNIILKFGSQWWSLPSNAVKVLIEKENRIKECFRFSIIPDESFVQTILAESGLGDNFPSNKRFIRWTGRTNHPDTLTMEDYDGLRNSGCFFARKFDENVDMEIVNKLYKELETDGYINNY